MARVKRGVTTRAKHKRILDSAKGYYGRRKNTIRIARQAVEKAGQYAYRDRKVKKRSFRALWIQRINAAVRAEGLTYGQFIHALNLAGITSQRSGPAADASASSGPPRVPARSGTRCRAMKLARYATEPIRISTFSDSLSAGPPSIPNTARCRPRSGAIDIPWSYSQPPLP